MSRVDAFNSMYIFNSLPHFEKKNPAFGQTPSSFTKKIHTKLSSRLPVFEMCHDRR